MEILKKFLSLSRLRQIAIAVCLAHLLAVFAMTCHHFATRRLRPAKPIVVRTLPPKSIASAPVAKQLETKQKPVPAQLPEKKSPPKTEDKKPVSTAKSSKPTASVNKPAASVNKVPVEKPEQEPPRHQDRALKEIAESLQSLATASETKLNRSAIVLPAALHQIKPKAQLAEESNSGDPTYGEYLIAYLQNALDLPEYGEVKMKIQIDRFGKPTHCTILDSRSSKNAEFLKNRLPELTFSCFNDFGITDLTLTFTITFRNVDH